MIIIPAIDIKDGLVVRLIQGKFNEATIYSRDPEAVARQWESAGAGLIHLVDLDGAKSGEITNWSVIEKVIKSVKVPIQVGGGIRKQEILERLLNLGAKRVVLGTKAVEDKDFIRQMVAKWHGRILISIDASGGKVAEKGWSSVTTKSPAEFAKEMQELGIKELVFTDISRDGTMAGPNIARIKELLSAITIPLIVAGGVSSLEDLKNLKALEKDGLSGVIVGKALYEGSVDFQQALKLC